MELHNRVTRQITLFPFNLLETKTYLASRQIHLTDYQLLQVYMVFGGVPYYLKSIDRGLSATQILNQLCFGNEAPLKYEFSNLYQALFDRADRHISLIQALSSRNIGLTTKDLAFASKIKSGGTLATILEELELSGFISSYTPLLNKKRQTLFRLTDEFSLFHLKFMSSDRRSANKNWESMSQSQSWKS